MQRLEAAKRKQQQSSKGEANPVGDEASSGIVDEDEMNKEDDETDEEVLEARKAAEYFEDGDTEDAPPGESRGGVPFQRLNLSRPLLRAVEAMGFVTPTPIQQKAVPFALAGR